MATMVRYVLRARKECVCADCGSPIRVGEPYSWTVFKTTQHKRKTCVVCRPLPVEEAARN